MVDQSTWGWISWRRAGGPLGRRAMRRAVLEYLLARRFKMPFDFLAPIVAFPTVGLIVQAASSYLPWLERFEHYGAWGIVAGWFMWRDNRQQKANEKLLAAAEKRNEKLAEILHGIAQTLVRMERKPCLYKIEMGEDEQADIT